MSWLLVMLNIADRHALQETYVDPIAEFFGRYGRMAILVLLLVGFYRVSDIVLGVIANVFYLDMGFNKNQIATVTKVFGIWMAIFGGFVGGFLTIRFGVLKILMLGAVMTVITNLLFIPVAQNPGNLSLLYVVIGADNITAGLATAAFVAYLSSLTNLSFTAMQYAMFSSMMTLFPKLLWVLRLHCRFFGLRELLYDLIHDGLTGPAANLGSRPLRERGQDLSLIDAAADSPIRSDDVNISLGITVGIRGGKGGQKRHGF